MRIDAGISPEDMRNYLSNGANYSVDITSIENGFTKLSMSQYLKWFYFSSTSKLQIEQFSLLTKPGFLFKSNSLRLYSELIFLFLCIMLILTTPIVLF